MFGTERLKQVIQTASDLAPREVILRMHSAVIEFADGTCHRVDVTAVIVKRTRPGGE